MRIEVRFNQDVAVMVLSGKFLAGSDGPFLRQKMANLIEAGARKLLVDFTQVPYIDSTGLGFLAGTRATTQEAGVTLVLSGLNQHVRKVLDSVQLSQFFTIVEDETAALAALQPMPQGAGTEPEPAKKTKAKKRSSDPSQ